MEVGDGSRVGEHIGDGHQHRLDSVDSLYFAKKINVQAGILWPLRGKDCWPLGGRLRLSASTLWSTPVQSIRSV
jgi:hypothetical protein